MSKYQNTRTLQLQYMAGCTPIWPTGSVGPRLLQGVYQIRMWLASLYFNPLVLKKLLMHEINFHCIEFPAKLQRHHVGFHQSISSQGKYHMCLPMLYYYCLSRSPHRPATQYPRPRWPSSHLSWSVGCFSPRAGPDYGQGRPKTRGPQLSESSYRGVLNLIMNLEFLNYES